MKKHPPGVIGFSVGDVVRYIEFVVSLQRVERPEGTTSSYGQSVSIPENMNRILRGMQPEHRWIWIQSDDHIWEADALMRLLDLQLDVVVPLIIRRGPPFVPVINKKVNRNKSHQPFPYADIPTDGSLLEVQSAGTGGMLLRRHVWEDIIQQHGEPVFEVDKGAALAEDYVLCRKIRKTIATTGPDKGNPYRIWCDPSVIMGHQGKFAVWPEVDNGKWRLRFDVGRTPDGQVSSFYYWTDNQENQQAARSESHDQRGGAA